MIWLKVVLGFFRGIGTLAWPWWIWILVLIFVNGAVPLAFWGTLEAKVILGLFLVGALVQMVLFRYLGYVRFLGIGHILVWVPLLGWLWGRLEGLQPGAPLGRWLLAVMAINAVSLLIDFVDVGRYLAGDRAPSLSVDDV